MLEMKSQCEKCEVALPKEGDANICSFECTFCTPCSESVRIAVENSFDVLHEHCDGGLVFRKIASKRAHHSKTWCKASRVWP